MDVFLDHFAGGKTCLGYQGLFQALSMLGAEIFQPRMRKTTTLTATHFEKNGKITSKTGIGEFESMHDLDHFQPDWICQAAKGHASPQAFLLWRKKGVLASCVAGKMVESKQP